MGEREQGAGSHRASQNTRHRNVRRADEDGPGRPAGFNLLKDTNKGYAFLYPFGWQEVSVDGEEVVYKDVIEPLESVSLSVTPAPEGKESIADFGNLDEVSETFISKVLTAPGQPYKTT